MELIRTERHLLKEMGFVCHVEHPHKFIFNYLQQLEVADEGVKQDAWNLANDRWGGLGVGCGGATHAQTGTQARRHAHMQTRSHTRMHEHTRTCANNDTR